ncbi:MAG: hypothetical protein JWM86_1183 [Thermoleophilia bacterium]|nr:hypothetical protein [Thermoleophilia bacterium]
MTAIGVHQGLASSFEEIVATNARLGGFSNTNMYPSQAEGTRVAGQAERLGNVAIDAAAVRRGDRALLTELGGAATSVANTSGRLAVMANQGTTFGDWRNALAGPVDAVRAGLAAQPGTARPARSANDLIAGFGGAIEDLSRSNGLLHAYSNRDIYPTASMGDTGRRVAREVSDLAIDLTLLDPNAAPTARQIMDGARKIGSNAGRMAIMANSGTTFASWSGAYDDALRALQDGLQLAAKIR